MPPSPTPATPRYGYPCLSLHGGKDQSDRECTISDFKTNVCSVLVATSIAARGLDVKELVLVLNYDVPNHHEDYVHRVGRTGRAGAKVRTGRNGGHRVAGALPGVHVGGPEGEGCVYVCCGPPEWGGRGRGSCRGWKEEGGEG